MFQNPHSKGVLVYEAEEEDRIHDASEDAIGFYSRVMSVDPRIYNIIEVLFQASNT